MEGEKKRAYTSSTYTVRGRKKGHCIFGVQARAQGGKGAGIIPKQNIKNLKGPV